MNPLLIRRRGMMGAQKAMVPIEWIGIRQGAYIDTGYVPQGQDIIIRTKLFLNPYPTTSYYAPWFVARTNATTSSYRIIRETSNSRIIFSNARIDNQSKDRSISGVNNLYDIILSVNGLNLNGTYTAFTTTASTTVNTSNMLIGEAQIARGVSENIYYFIIEKGGVTVVDLIPVRVGAVGYMYDRVSGQLFGNSGTGDFVLGPDIQ